MKRLLTLMVLCVLATSAMFAQKVYPTYTIRQLQQAATDSLLIADTLSGFDANSTQTRWTLQTSPHNGDTVTVVGLCVVPYKIITYTASGWTMVLYDTAANTTEWGGILVRGNAPADTARLILNGFTNVSQGDVVKMTGVISEFPTQRGFSLTQFQPLADSLHTIEFIDAGRPIPAPIVKTTGDFYTGLFPAGKTKYSTGEPMEGMYVELHNLTVTQKVNATRGTFSMADALGNEISEYDWSHYFTLGHVSGSVTVAPADTAWTRIYAALGQGMKVDTIRGIISTASGSEGPRGYRISPIYPHDIVFGVLPQPPLVSTHRRNPVVVTSDTNATVSVKVTKQTNGASPKTITLLYSVNNAAFVPLSMAYHASDTTYVATIPKQTAGATVRYFMEVVDSVSQIVRLANSALTAFATDTSKGFFFYKSLNQPLTITDVQYTPYVNGRSPYLGGVVTLSGVITADTTQLTLTPASSGATSTWYMQNGAAPWSGIWLTTTDTLAVKQLSALKNGDSVSVTGTVQENFDVTRLGSITPPVVVRTSGNALPAPVVRSTGSFNVGNGSSTAEPYEGMLIKFNNVTVTNVAPTFSDATEYSVNDGSGEAVIRRDGTNSYSNIPADSASSGKTILRVGNKISSLTGIVFYSFNQYKIVPRSNADFVGVVLTAVNQVSNEIPSKFALTQNYPNPFNPSTMIEFSLPTSGMTTLKIYNVLGQEVRTLINEVKAPGRYTARFDAASLPTGMYIYRIQSGTFTQTKKMLLLK